MKVSIGVVTDQLPSTGKGCRVLTLNSDMEGYVEKVQEREGGSGRRTESGT